MKIVGFIGSGMIGSSLARLAVAAGLEVVLSNSRAPETLAGLAASLGERATVATPAEAAQAADIVVAAIPLYAYTQLPVEALRGKTMLDTANYYPERDGHLPELDDRILTSSALIQRHFVGTRVVKAFNNITPHQLLTLARPAGAPDRSALPIAGDHSKEEAAHLLDLLGFDAVDLGALSGSWRSEPNTPVYVTPYLGEIPALDVAEFLDWTTRTPGIPVSAAQIGELVSDVVRQSPGEVLLPRA